ncbi:helix-turn-helix domain-containing protein [Streptomyces sp. NPDC096080]|uniref:helix-turn-helix domain-containing protein n=1 Tax=unclassified Streptomyces TaxID=2593676 RepID=UPI003320CD5F
MSEAEPYEDRASGGGIGPRIREARRAAGLSVRELARRVNVSASHISQVERGLSSFSVPVLYTVAAELGVPMDSVFDGPQDTVTDLSEAALDGAEPLVASGIVQRRSQRPVITMGSGLQWHRLTARPSEDCEFLEVRYPPGANSSDDGSFIRHQGWEYGVIIEGSLTVEVGFEKSLLKPGDAINFDSSTPHRFSNDTGSVVRAVWFVRDRADGAGNTGPHSERGHGPH